MKQIKATYRQNNVLAVLTIVSFMVVAWFVRHIYQIVNESGTELTLNLVWLFTFIVLSWTTITALLDKPKKTINNQELDKLNVAVLVPVYNEDPALLTQCIKSILHQTRKPQSISIVDDGSKVDYDNLTKALRNLSSDIDICWQRTDNHGKRHAQGIGIKRYDTADIYLTVDSDTVLDPSAIEEGLKPFLDDKVMSVAGLVMAINNDENILTRFTGVWEVMWQLLDRSSQSLFKSVTVNSGPLAFYRGPIIRKYLDAYLNEDFFGIPVKFSDDSLMTMYSLLHGQTVQQPTSIAFSATPNKVSHNIRRYVRWMRGSFIRTWWRFRYLDMTSYAFGLQFLRWFQMLLSTFIFFYIVYIGATVNSEIYLYMLFVPIAVTYIQGLVYFNVRRNDQTIGSQIINYLLLPLSVLWTLTVLRVVRWYGYVTCYKTGWGTRKNVEVGLNNGS